MNLEKITFVYLSQSVPVSDGFSWISQHFIPVISSKAHSIWPGSTYTDHLIVSNPVASEILAMKHIEFTKNKNRKKITNLKHCNFLDKIFCNWTASALVL